jgi:hypothetical protein
MKSYSNPNEERDESGSKQEYSCDSFQHKIKGLDIRMWRFIRISHFSLQRPVQLAALSILPDAARCQFD